MKKFIVDRKKWYRGKGPDSSKLLNYNGQMCCVGFFAKQILNKNDEDIEYKPTLMSMDIELDNTIKQFLIYQINDSIIINDNIRETKLKQQFAKLGYEVEFIN